MSAHAQFTATADPFFAVTKAVRAELKDLQKLATDIQIGARNRASGGGSAGGTRSGSPRGSNTVAGQSREAAAAARAEAAATRASIAAIDKLIATRRLAITELRKGAIESRQTSIVEKLAQKSVNDEFNRRKQAAAATAREIHAGMRRNGTELNRFGVNVRSVNSQLKDLPKDIRIRLRVNGGDEIAKIEADIKNAARAELKENAGDVVANVATGTGLAIAGGFGLASKAAIDFEKQFAQVRKTVGGSTAMLDALAVALRKTATEIPVTTEELSSIAANAGQLGVQSSSILKFTRTVADLSRVAEMTSDEASSDMAKLANITQMPQKNFDRLGSTIARLGNIGASGAKDILNMALRIAGAGHTVGMTETQILGTANALSSLGIEAEMGGSAFSQSLISIAKSSGTGSKELKLFAAVAQMSTREFKTLFDTNASEAITRFAEGLGKLPKSQVFTALDQLGLKGIRVQDTLLRAAGAGKLMRESIEQGNTAWNRNNELNQKAGELYSLTSSKIQIAQNQFNDFGITVGTKVLPMINSVLKSLSAMFDWFNRMSPALQENIIKGTAYAAIVLLLVGRLKSLVGAYVLVKTALFGATVAAEATTAATITTTGAFGAMRTALAGLTLQGAFAGIVAILPIILAVAAAAGVAYLAFDAWQSRTEKLANAQRELNEIAGKTSHVMDQAFEYSKDDPAILKMMGALRTQIANAGSDSTKLDAALKQLTEAKRRITLSTKLGNSAKALLIDDLGMTADFIVKKEAVLKVKMDETSKSWWQNFFDHIDEVGHKSGFSEKGDFSNIYKGAQVVNNAAWSPSTGWTFDRNQPTPTPAAAPKPKPSGWKLPRSTQNVLGIPQAKSNYDFGLGSFGFKSNQTPSLTATFPQSKLDKIVGPPVTHAQLLENARREAAARARTRPTSSTRNGNSAVTDILNESAAEKAAKAANAAKKKAETEANKIRAAALRVQKDQLNDLATTYEAQSRRIEAVANKQIEQWTRTRDTLRGIFGSIQDQFVALGVVDDPMGPTLRSFERLLGLESRIKTFGQTAVNTIRDLNTKSADARSQSEIISGLDGNVPTSGGGTSGSGMTSATGVKIADAALRMQASGEADDFVKRCQALARTTFQKVTHSYDRYFSGSALSTMRNFQSAGIGQNYTPGMATAPGGLLYSSSLGHGSGHVQTIGPNGERLDQYGKNKFKQSNFQYYVPPPGARNIAGSSTRSGGGNSSGVGLPNGDGASALADTLANFEGGLVKIAAVDKAWGAAVKNMDGNSVRFAIQTQLSSSEFQTQIAKIAQTTGKTVPEIIAWFRRLANEADTKLNRVKAIDAVRDSLLDLQKQTRAMRRDGNPLAALDEEMRVGGKYGAAPERDKENLRQATLRLSLEGARKATIDLQKSESDRIRVLDIAAPSLNAATAGTDAYERALENANRQVEAWKAPDVAGLLKAAEDYDKAGGKMLRMAQAIKNSGLDLFGVMSGSVADKGNSSKATAASLRSQAAAMVKTRLRVQSENAEYARATTRKQENIDANFELDNRIALLKTEHAILLDNTKTEAQKTAQIERANFILAEQVKLMGLGHSEARAKELATQRADKEDVTKGFGVGNDAVRAFNANTLEATQNLATFGDSSGLAALKFDMAQGSLKDLTAAQKAQMLVETAAIQGLANYGQQYDALYSQQFTLQAEFATRQAQLSGPQTELQKQELAWKAQDLESSTRLVSLTDAQRAAYEAQRPAVEKLRDAVRGLMTDAQKLAAPEWFKDYATRAREAIDPQGAARSALGDSLRSSGVDETQIKIILDDTDLESKFAKTQERVQNFVGQVNGIMSQGMDELYADGFEGFFASVAHGFSDLLDSISKQIISAALTKLIMNAFPQLATIYDGTQQKVDDLATATVKSAVAATQAAIAYTAAAKAAAAFAAAGGGQVPSSGTGLLGSVLGIIGAGSNKGAGIGSSSGLLGAGASALGSGGLFPTAGLGGGFSLKSHAIGLDRVPYNGYAARLHRDEAILNASDAHQWRGMQSAMVAPNSSTRSGGAQVNNHIGTINLPNVQKPEDFAPALRAVTEERASRRSMRQGAYDQVSGGSKGR